ncbi:MAG: rRNA maturation RNase YbeY [Alphaproteobacteria bacterium]|nr:rRNA maturation RNase YbeY [Alphaproteobacteria bacterium]
MTDAVPALSVDIALAVLDERWLEVLPSAKAVARRAATTALAQAALPEGPVELSLALMDDAQVRGLNRDYRDQDAATNVLAFAGETLRPGDANRPLLLGDVVIAFETTAAEAKAQGKTLSDHLSHLVVHGVLHLLGYDHGETQAAEEMEGLERAVLARLGIADPYAAETQARVAGEAG